MKQRKVIAILAMVLVLVLAIGLFGLAIRKRTILLSSAAQPNLAAISVGPVWEAVRQVRRIKISLSLRRDIPRWIPTVTASTCGTKRQ